MKAKTWRFMQWQRAIFNYFLPYAKIDQAYLIVLGVLSLLMTAANAFLIWKLGIAVALISSQNFAALNQTLLLIAGVVLFNQILRLSYAYIFQRVTLRFVDRLRGQLLNHIMYLSFPINYQFTRGDLIARLTNDVDRILTYVINVPLNIFSYIIVVSIYGSLLFWIDWQLALIALSMAPVFFLSQHYVAPKTGNAARHFVKENASLISIEEQTLANLRCISAFNSETIIREKHQNQFDIARWWALRVRQIRILYNTFFTFLVYLAGVVVVYSGIANIQSGQLTIGVLVSFLVYIRNLTGPVGGIARLPIVMHNDRAAAERIMEVMSMQPNLDLSCSKDELRIRNGKIDFNNVSFCYPNTSDKVFDNLSVTINAGESIALVGPSGSGKSTFAGLLLRFYDPQSGTISIDDIDIKTVTLTSLRNQLSIVWQEPFLINGTIAENLLLARPDATLEQMVAACKSGFAWEFVEKLEHGLNTIIGPNGINLSVGQIQRLAIAQVFLRDTPILLLDEASSALDSMSEKMVVEALQSLRKNRTTLIIAHRFSSIRSADRILYFNDDGTITAGTHESLMSNHSNYQDAVNWQTAPR